MSTRPEGQPMSVLLIRARARQRRFVAFTFAPILVPFALLIPAAMRGMPDASTIAPQRTWQPPATAEAFSGEMQYEFDSTLNRTSARFVVALGSRGIVHKIFFSNPVVHTLVVSYKYAGMRASRGPDTVRVSFKSDEYTYSAVENGAFPAMDAYLEIALGEQRLTYPLAIAQRTEVTATPAARNHEGAYLRGDAPLGRSAPSMVEIHVARTATAWLPICDFLELTNQQEIRGSVAGLEFSLDREAVAGLRRFAAEMGEAVTKKLEAGRGVIDCTGR